MYGRAEGQMGYPGPRDPANIPRELAQEIAMLRGYAVWSGDPEDDGDREDRTRLDLNEDERDDA